MTVTPTVEDSPTMEDGNGNVDDNAPSGHGHVSDDNSDAEKAFSPSETAEWDGDAKNPYNWPTWKKTCLVFMICSMALNVAIATSIISPSRAQLMAEFNISSTVALLPLTFYILALGFGPVVGGPLSETIGRHPVYLGGMVLGALFTLGIGFARSFPVLCLLRFLAGFCWAPLLSVPPGSFSEVFHPTARGPMTAIFVLMPFLGPGFGPVIGSFVSVMKGWRWTQWTLLFFSIACLLLTPFSQETFHPILKRRIAKERGEKLPPLPPLEDRLRTFAVVAVVRPVRMLFTEPIVAFTCLYVALNFGTLFSFFAGLPYVFSTVYSFDTEQSGLVFLSIAIGSLIGLATVMLCDMFLYRRQIPRYPPRKVPPEHRLYPAMIGSFGLPIGLFWFAWTARSSLSWVSPAVAIMPFAWGNLCVFVSAIQYTTDTYTGNVVASASSANSLARYVVASVFPLFTIQMYERLEIQWASSLLAFIAVALLPIPWVLYKYGPQIRAKSKFETLKYEE